MTEPQIVCPHCRKGCGYSHEDLLSDKTLGDQLYCIECGKVVMNKSMKEKKTSKESKFSYKWALGVD